MSTQIKRPILLQVKSLHDGPSDDQEDPPLRLRPTKTQSLVLPSPTCQTPKRASLTADFDHQLRHYYSSSKVSNLKSPTGDRSSTYSSSSSTFSSASSSAANSAETTATDSPEEPSLILPYLYVGDQAQTQIDTISNLNISYILSLQSLPKFLSNLDDSIANSANQPISATTTNTIALDKKEASPSTSCDRANHRRNHRSRHSHSKSRLSRQDNVELSNGVSVQQQVSDKKRQLSSGAELYDIIDGGDGCLLPSMNSSKDYLVKIKPLDVGGSEVEKKQIIEHVPLESGVSLDSNNLNDHSDDDEDDDISEDFSAVDGETKCDSQFVNKLQPSKTKGPTNKLMDINDDELMNCNNQRIKKCPGALLRQTLERRCNKLSSSVHRLIRGKCINISDTFETLVDKFFDETHNFIEEARRNKCNVLVHCKAGISRSPTIAIAYLMKWKRLHLQDAYNFVKRCRPQISPNLNFMGQLVSYERQLQLVGNGCCRPLHFRQSSSQSKSQPITSKTLSREKTTTSGDELNVPPQT